MNRHIFFAITACIITGVSPLIFQENNNMLTFIFIALAALFIQVYWRDVLVQALIIKGHFASKKGNYKKVQEAYTQIHKLMPNSFAGKMAMGVIHSLQGNWGHAESNFRQALYFKPGNLYVCLNLSVVLLRRERYEEVIKLLKSLIYAYPKNIMAYKMLAEAYYYVGKLHEAIHYIRVAKLLYHNDTEAEKILKTIESKIKDAA